jgi:two-component system NtrC family sensor kinase
VNGNQDFACEIKQDIYRNTLYKGQTVGFISIYQGQAGILTCPYGIRESAADSFQLEEEGFYQVAAEGRPWIGQELLMGNQYLTASQPIWNPDYETIGVLQVGTIEQRYLDIRDQIIVAFISITLIGSLVAILFAYFTSRRISIPIKRLLTASRNLAAGDLDAHVDTSSVTDEELVELGMSFNAMASALKERDQALRELSRYRIQRSERLAFIGKLAANVAHELNNPLQGIVTYSHLMLEDMHDEDPQHKYVQIIVTQADRCREIIRGLLDFSRQREPDKKLCDVNVILQDCIMLLINQALFQNIEIDSDIDIDLPPVVADPSQLERVFANLMVNAAEAMNGCGKLTLITRKDRLKQAIEVLISDTGHGIAEEDLKRIFDPFYTTKEVGKGTGLGLAISYGITMEHGGELSVESEVGRGTTFTMRLPIGDGLDK